MDGNGEGEGKDWEMRKGIGRGGKVKNMGNGERKDRGEWGGEQGREGNRMQKR